MMNFSNFKESVKQNKNKLSSEQEQRANVLSLRNKFLGEWASSILGLKKAQIKDYIDNVMVSDYKKPNYKVV